MKAIIEFDDELYPQLKTTAPLRGAKALRHADASKQLRRLKLPIVKSRNPGTLKLTNKMIAEHEAGIEARS